MFEIPRKEAEFVKLWLDGFINIPSNEGTIELTPEMIQRLKEEEYRRSQPRNRSGNAPKFDKNAQRTKNKLARKARKKNK